MAELRAGARSERAKKASTNQELINLSLHEIECIIEVLNYRTGILHLST